MIRLHRLTWSNWYSYGQNNELTIDENIITQILGLNGSGKSSIPLIIEEILFGKNSKGVKKQDIANRHSGIKGLHAVLEFYKENDLYKIVLDRKSSIKLSLYKNNVDISEHTSTGTYKEIEKIIGFDFKTFNQLIYQSSTSSLQFLKATDTQRKNFLIALFGLDRYVELSNLFKDMYKEVSKSVSVLEGKCQTLQKWIDNHKNKKLEKQELLEVPAAPDEKVKELAMHENELKDIDKINRKINQNNTYKEMLSRIDMSILTENIEDPGDENFSAELTKFRMLYKQAKDKVDKINKLGDVCHCCMQIIPSEIKDEMLLDERKIMEDSANKAALIEAEKSEYTKRLKKFKQHQSVSKEIEDLNARIDYDIQSIILDEQDLKSRISILSNDINNIKKEISNINNTNNKISSDNAEIDVIKKQLKEYTEILEKESDTLNNLSNKLINIDILKKCFSPTGLVGYKLEFLVKDLEKEINKYLNEFSSGRFQLNFVLKSDKLNIDILDDGSTIDISLLSSGELARVNASTLLAIRKLMTELSKNKINVLFLDEIMGVLDDFGREKLIEILLEEKDLNIFLVSHSYTHPLLSKVTIVKENNISRVENG